MSSSESSAGLLEKVQTFVAENRRAVLIGSAAAALAVGGAVYLASTSRPGAPDVEKAAKKAKKAAKGGKKRKTVKDKDGPILEERKPKATAEEDAKVYTAEEIAAMSEEERQKVASSFKARGNSAYQARQFATAAELYTRAIEVSPKAEPVFYSNRAACYINLSPPKYDEVIADCDEALRLDTKYVKALNRRAMALEAVERYQEALRDFTAATILDKFQNQSAAQSVERVLKKLSALQAAEIMKGREPRLPSHTFIAAYFAAFRPRPQPTLPEEPTTGDNTLLLAIQATEAADYIHAVSLVNEAIEQGISWDTGKAEALNLRGTFKFLMGDIDGAKADLEESLKLVPSFTQSLVKLASVHMEQGDPQSTFECFERAITFNPSDPDIYYHRGQVLFIMSDFMEASKNYTKSTELDDQFVFSHIQNAVAEYKVGNIAHSMATFRRTLVAFPQRSEPHNYYGELLMDQQRFEDAVEKFDKAFEIEKTKRSPNVLPLVNKGLALYQWKQDIGAAERCCREALEIDPECEAAVATLAQLSLQQSKIDGAVEMFDRQAELARSEPELTNALTYKYAALAQSEFAKNYPAMALEMQAMAASMA
ncbi:mitochondrial outer membrane translocase receptor TOM70 [Schizophyllum amplum]|uniref:Mitochondrial outer membrane translocase receptor TOM70 n=1 Tax=Schizophyllum amplum TaxID=97359 RepID=A0A550CPQ1_9AGAR|nr:mitochondrial outer membrane translocase receptor TOM70 [Auriculariopsis ampla]